MFFVLEGIDGAGKSSVVRELKAYLANRVTRDVLTLRTPGASSEVGDTIRDLLLNPRFTVCDEALPLLFMADMMQVDRLEVGPALAAGKLVIVDRYVDSTYVYQINTSKLMTTREGTALASRLVPALYSVFTPPTTVFVLDVEPEEAKRRLDVSEYGSADRFEANQQAWQARRDAYQFLATQADMSMYRPTLDPRPAPKYELIDVTSKSVSQVTKEIGEQIIAELNTNMRY